MMLLGGKGRGGGREGGPENASATHTGGPTAPMTPP